MLSQEGGEDTSAHAAGQRLLDEAVPEEDDKAKNRLRFMARQYIDALSPANFAATNPEFIKQAVESKGQSITAGIQNLIAERAQIAAARNSRERRLREEQRF